MAMTVKQAFAAHGLKAEFRGFPAKILPVDADMKIEICGDPRSPQVEIGQMIASWNEDGERRGSVLNAGAANDIQLLVDRNVGDPTRVSANDMKNVAARIVAMENQAGWERDKVDAANAKARDVHDAALGRGETPDEHVDRQPTYGDTAFARFPRLVACIDQGIGKMLEQPFTHIEARSAAYAARYELGRANANVLSPEEMVKITTVRALREEIASLNQGNAADRPYVGDGEASRDLIGGLRGTGRGFSSAQMSAMAGNPALCNDLFGVLTKTPVSQIIGRHLHHTDFEMVTQELSRNQETVWSPEALDRINAVLADRIPGYQFEAKFFTKEDADVLVIRDHVGAYLYSWDSDSRVAEINLADKVLSTFTKADIPTDEQINALRLELNELRFDNGEEINFDFGEDEDIAFDDNLMDAPEDEDLDDDDPTNIDNGPRR